MVGDEIGKAPVSRVGAHRRRRPLRRKKCWGRLEVVKDHMELGRLFGWSRSGGVERTGDSTVAGWPWQRRRARPSGGGRFSHEGEV
jgi:hypothetical protein